MGTFAGYLLGVVMNIILFVLNSVILFLSFTLDGFEFNASALSVTYAFSFALGIAVTEPLLCIFRYYILGVRAILVDGGGNGGQIGSTVVPLSPTESKESLIIHGQTSGQNRDDDLRRPVPDDMVDDLHDSLVL